MHLCRTYPIESLVDGNHCKYPHFTLDLEVTQNIAQYPLHHDIYAHAKLKVATSNHFYRDVFTRNTVFDLDLGIKVT